MAILLGKMMLEIFQIRWYQLSSEEKKRVRSVQRWFESFKQLGQSFALLFNGFLNFLKSFTNKSEKPLKEKKWVHPELKEEIKKKVVDESGLPDSNQIRNKQLTENEETS